MTRIINIAGNSGSGKSLIALNLGIALSQKGKDLLLFDANIYSPDIANYSDIIPRVFLNEYLNGEKELDKVITYHPSGMKMIPSMLEEDFDPIKHAKINEALLQLHGKSEIVLVDSFSQNPAMFSILSNSDETIFVTNDDFTSISKSKEFIRQLENKGIGVIGAILNRKRKHTNTKNVQAILGKRILAEIPHDDKIIDSVNKKQPICFKYPNSLAAKAINDLAELINHS